MRVLAKRAAALMLLATAVNTLEWVLTRGTLAGYSYVNGEIVALIALAAGVFVISTLIWAFD